MADRLIKHAIGCLERAKRQHDLSDGEISMVIKLLKEREEVEPIKDIARNRKCPNCLTILKGKFCHECGQAVKLE